LLTKFSREISSFAIVLYLIANLAFTGFSAGHHIRQRVVLEAKRMGRYSDAGMKEIAYNLGFLDSAHFSSFFKTYGGINFSEFKRGALIVPLDAALNRA
jgi:AraC family transcriptional activator of pobA